MPIIQYRVSKLFTECDFDFLGIIFRCAKYFFQNNRKFQDFASGHHYEIHKDLFFILSENDHELSVIDMLCLILQT